MNDESGSHDSPQTVGLHIELDRRINYPLQQNDVPPHLLQKRAFQERPFRPA